MATKNQIALLSVCAIVVLFICDCKADQFHEHTEQIRKVCQEKTKVATEVIDGLSSGKFPEGNKDLKCYVGCALEQMKSMKDGKIDKATCLQMIDTVVPENLREGAKKALNVCSGGKFDAIADPCDLAWETLKCWSTEDPSMKFP